ncbi:MAG TPA: universal stress protein [Acidisarcina sp.]|nr:universal stress protein [Acidisarcina sp.]
MKILVAIDDSKSSEQIVPTMVSQFRVENAEVRVLHVLQPIAPLAPPEMAEGYAPELEDLKAPARKRVEQVAGELRSAGFKAESAVVVGDVRDTILASATDWHADLIVVGSHGQRGIQTFLLGSVAEFVARHAKCSVEIIR